MSSDEQKVDINEIKEANRKDATDDVKSRVTEAQKRYQVAKEIEEHRFFKNLKRNANENNVAIALDVIVNAYFDSVSGTADNMPTYTVDDTLIVKALQQTMYLLSFIENGIVFDPDGNINIEASLEQQEEMGSVRVGFDTLSDEEKKEVFTSVLEKGISNGEFSEKVDADLLLKSFETFDAKDLSKYLNSDEGKEVIDAALNGENNEAKVKGNRIRSNLEDEEDVRINEIQGKIYNILSKPKEELTQAEYQELYLEMQKLEKFKDGEAKKFLNKEGRIDPNLVVTDYIEYVSAYSSKEHEKTLQKYGGKKLQKVYSFDKLPPDHKRKVMEAALALYMQPEGKDRSEAMIVLSALDVLKDDPQNGERIIDVDAFREVYNSTSKMSNLTFEQILKNVWKKDIKAVQTHTHELYEQVLNGTFTERWDKDLLGEKKQEEEEIVITEDKPKEKFWDKVNRRLQENYEKALEYEAIKKFDDLTGKLNDTEKADCIKKVYASTAYQLMRNKAVLRGLKSNEPIDESKILNIEMKIMKLQETNGIVTRYMVGHEKFFGDAIDQGEIKSGKIRYNSIKWNQKEDRNRLKEMGITPAEIIQIFDEVADYTMTPTRVARGIVESTKDVAGVLYRKVKFSLLGKAIGNRVLSLADKNYRSLSTADRVNQFKASQYDIGALEEVAEAFKNEETFKEFSNRKKEEIERKALEDKNENEASQKQKTTKKTGIFEMLGRDKSSDKKESKRIKSPLKNSFDQYVVSEEEMRNQKYMQELAVKQAKKNQWKQVLMRHGVKEKEVEKLSTADMAKMIEEYNDFAERNGKEMIQLDGEGKQGIEDGPSL